MKKLLLLAAVAVLSLPGIGKAQTATVVAAGACGIQVLPVGINGPLIEDATGNLCTSATASGTFDDAAVAATGGAVPAAASYGGIVVGSTLRGQTGVNPSGSIYATQVDLASVAGVTVKTGVGTASGSIRTVIASDQAALTTQITNSFSNITTSTTTTAKSGAGVLHTVCVNTLGTVASLIVVYDNTAGSGTKIASINSLAFLGCQTYDVAFATGLTVVTTGAPDVTVSYR